ncbi:MAG: roadblock/LC7 domain-containing protein [Desulfurococcales archaeon]|nr:roadblock/LC7 domain-containing protein [Desulfurococcales archaeon]MEB3846652.1 roadblock/LC7 domain-containing protein [Desulfurococcales archaeon]
MSTPIQRILGEMTRSPGVVAVFIVSKEGFIIEKASTGTLTIDEDAFAAMLTTVYGATTQLGEELQIGKPETTTLEYPGHYILVHDLGENLLAILADKSRAVLGRLRYELRKQAPRISGAL